MDKQMKKNYYSLLLSLFVGGSSLPFLTSCADDDLLTNGTDGSHGIAVRFNVNTVQEDVLSRSSRLVPVSSIVPELTKADLTPRKLEARMSNGQEVNVIETTVEGVKPVENAPSTRANVETAITNDFTSLGYRGFTATSISTKPEWFYAQPTKPNGELYSALRWSWQQPWARFFAIYPSLTNYSKMSLSPESYAGNPYIDFEVDKDVTKQVDFMTASTGDVHYAVQGEAPTTNLAFRHALTAVQFAVGQNLSYNKVIDRIEIRNVLLKGRYVLSDKYDGAGAKWALDQFTERGTVTLDNIKVSTSKNPNTIITGVNNDNYTFYMIPQTLTGNNVTAYIHFDDNTSLTVPLRGDWKPGTTRTFKLGQKNSTWDYVLTTESPAPVYFTAASTDNYRVTSYRIDPVTETKQPVAWKITGYSIDDGKTWNTDKPSWLSELTLLSGDGGEIAQTGLAFLKKDGRNLLSDRLRQLTDAKPLGTSASPYDLSTRGGKTLCNTANCYVISAPGFYRIPLVYGNAIKDGNTNESSYKTNVTGAYVLRNFVDHDDKAITDPWIEKTNNGANAGIDGAKIVWEDERNLVHLPTNPIVRNGDETYLEFEVRSTDIKQGNAVVAVTKKGTTLWSWHLWFAPQDVLTPVEFTNAENKKYSFIQETLGWKYTEYEGSTFSEPRIVKLRVEQQYGNNGNVEVGVITIRQNPGWKIQGNAPFYQFGRKDPAPGVASLFNNSGFEFDLKEGDRSIAEGIKHPGTFFHYTNQTKEQAQHNWFTGSYDNLWSADNTTGAALEQNVVKTIYDPSPVGFKMPPSNVLGGIDINRAMWYLNNPKYAQVFREAFGSVIWTNTDEANTLILPAVGGLSMQTGQIVNRGESTGYWTAIPDRRTGLLNGHATTFAFSATRIVPLSNDLKSNGHSVRPITE